MRFCTSVGVDRSLCELAELTGLTQTAIRRALDQAGVPRRGRGAQVVHDRLDTGGRHAPH